MAGCLLARDMNLGVAQAEVHLTHLPRLNLVWHVLLPVSRDVTQVQHELSKTRMFLHEVTIDPQSLLLTNSMH